MPFITCHRCATQYLLPDELYKAAKCNEGIHFWCPYGHQAHYPAGETAEDKLRRERDRLTQRLAQRDDEIKSLEARRRAAVGQTTKLKKRASAGTCPCCSRTFSNMAEHMKAQHPEFVTDSGAKVIPIKRAHANQ